MEETLGNTVVIGNLLVTEAPARFSLVFTMVGRTSRGIGSIKLRPNSYKKNKTTRQGEEIQWQGNMKTTHRRMIRGTSSSSSPSVSTKATKAPAEKKE